MLQERQRPMRSMIRTWTWLWVGVIVLGAIAGGASAAESWWSFGPLSRPAVPEVKDPQQWIRTPIDAFVLQKLYEKKLIPSAEADRRTLIRRLGFDLIGLPPSAEEVEAFVADKDPKAYEKLVDRLLASSHYGERWARHWLDVAHYADTHGYDKDQLRNNAWPYRDYVIRAFNQDKPWTRFIQEQVAGDVLYPETIDGIIATGFMAAGPWDLIGHEEVSEKKIDGMVARNIDRDDMVRTVLKSFTSITVGCARCHDHKFDPITMKDYYSLQAIFASLDRANRQYDMNNTDAKKRLELMHKHGVLRTKKDEIWAAARQRSGPEMAALDKQISELRALAKTAPKPAFGYHSKIEKKEWTAKWVQVDLGSPQKISEIVLVGAHDTYNNIGEGFGFPVRFEVQVSNNPAFKKEDVNIVASHFAADYPNPGVKPVVFKKGILSARYVRVAVKKLAPRSKDYIFALGELMVRDAAGKNLAQGRPVSSADSVEAKPRWSRANVVDGHYHRLGNGVKPGDIAKLVQHRKGALGRGLKPEDHAELKRINPMIDQLARQLKQLKSGKGLVYASIVHKGRGHFRGRAGLGPRPIYILARGEVTQKGEKVSSGVPPFIAGIRGFNLPEGHKEGDARVKLAEWLTRKDHPLTWRSAVNRVWSFHFGQGIADSPNDLGRMGSKPTHPKLLDWLAAEFRDGGQSLKKLHKLMVTSSVYRQVSSYGGANAKQDGGNQYLWRMNRRRLDAESVRDSVLVAAGKMNFKMGGPGYRDFVLEKTANSPHYEYEKHNPDDASTHRRSIYRFIVRSQTQPMMTTFDCADPAQQVAKRGETLTPLQALALMNNPFMVRMYENMATDLERASKDPKTQINLIYRRALSRDATAPEVDVIVAYAQKHGLANACRLVLNLNEFIFVD
jgi:hypothetical protein